ncbi:MAG: hypothetical protein WBK91_08145 [Alphaproteobacteria bacterium]
MLSVIRDRRAILRNALRISDGAGRIIRPARVITEYLCHVACFIHTPNGILNGCAFGIKPRTLQFLCSRAAPHRRSQRFLIQANHQIVFSYLPVLINFTTQKSAVQCRPGGHSAFDDLPILVQQYRAAQSTDSGYPQQQTLGKRTILFTGKPCFYPAGLFLILIHNTIPVSASCMLDILTSISESNNRRLYRQWRILNAAYPKQISVIPAQAGIHLLLLVRMALSGAGSVRLHRPPTCAGITPKNSNSASK